MKNITLEESKKTSVYSYKLIDAELNLWKACEKKIRKGLLCKGKPDYGVCARVAIQEYNLQMKDLGKALSY